MRQTFRKLLPYCGFSAKPEKRGNSPRQTCFIAAVSSRKGFSLVEMLVTLAISAIIVMIVTGVFSKATSQEALDKEAAILLSILEQARNQTLSAKDGSAYGVHFETSKAALFTGPSYSGGNGSNAVEPMNPLVKISAISLSGGGSEVIFKRLTGETDQSGTVTLSLVASSNQTRVITVFATGLVQSN